MITSNHWAPWPPIYVVAYMLPASQTTPEQTQLDIETIAKFPMAITGQETWANPWHQQIKNINPDIKLLPYQMIAQDRTIHANLRLCGTALADLQDPWITLMGR